MNIWNRMEEICVEKGTSLFQLLKKAHVAYSSSYQMRNKGVPPTLKTLEKFCFVAKISISDFFNTPEFVYLTKDQKEFLERWSALTGNEKQAIFRLIHEFKKIKVDNKRHSCQKGDNAKI